MRLLIALARLLFGLVLPLLMIAGLVAVGVYALRQGQRQTISAPLTPLAQAASHVGDVVRLQGQAAEGSDPVTTASGEKLAAERVQVVLPEPRLVPRLLGMENVDFDMVTPGALAITDGTTTLEVQTANLDVACWPPRVEATLHGSLPDNIRQLLSDRLPDPPTPDGGRIRVWTLALGAPIVVYGKVAQDEKKIVMTPSYKQDYIVSPLTWEQATAIARRGNRPMDLLAVGALLAAAALLTVWMLLVRRTARVNQEVASA
ncbi:MAG: hypothetical protein ACYCW6_06950 [Candidatus Xenobia bacterium]